MPWNKRPPQTCSDRHILNSDDHIDYFSVKQKRFYLIIKRIPYGYRPWLAFAARRRKNSGGVILELLNRISYDPDFTKAAATCIAVFLRRVPPRPLLLHIPRQRLRSFSNT